LNWLWPAVGLPQEINGLQPLSVWDLLSATVVLEQTSYCCRADSWEECRFSLRENGHEVIDPPIHL
jgi:hypothetical protein